MPDFFQTYSFLIGGVFLFAALAMGLSLARDLVPEDLASSVKLAAFLCFGLFAAVMLYEILPRVRWLPAVGPAAPERRILRAPRPAEVKTAPPVTGAARPPKRPEPKVPHAPVVETESKMEAAPARRPAAAPPGSKPVIREIDDEEARRLMEAARQRQKAR